MTRWMTTLLLLASTALAHAQYEDVPGFPKDPAQQKIANAGMTREAEGLWKKVEWRASIDAAKADAKKLGKPLMVFFVVGELGKKGEGPC